MKDIPVKRSKEVRRYYQHEVSPEDREKLKLSMQGLEGIVMREIRCPWCGNIIDVVGSDTRSGHKRAMCGKCKEVFIIDYRYFRTMKRQDKYRPQRIRPSVSAGKRQVR